MQPVAIKTNLTIRELAEETLIYDKERHAMHCLNRTSALVWKRCDGRHDVAALAAVISRELQLSAGDADAAVRLALEQLSRRHLLQEAVAPAAEEERLSRRAALRKLAKAAAVALPLVMTLKSPSIAWAGGPAGAICRTPLDCESGICVKSNNVSIGNCAPPAKAAVSKSTCHTPGATCSPGVVPTTCPAGCTCNPVVGPRGGVCG